MDQPTTESPIAPDLTVEVAGIKLKNPVMAASGTFGYGDEAMPYMDLAALGAICTKGLGLRPRAGNVPSRIAETAAGMLNSIGLQNIGVRAFERDKLPLLTSIGVPVVANFYGHTLREFTAVARRLGAMEGVAALEANISCPNIDKGGFEIAHDPKETHRFVAAARRAAPDKPLIVKLSPNVTDITETAKAAVEAGADALSVINTILGMAVNVEKRKPELSSVTGGLSGPAIKPVALRMVWEVARAVEAPVIGIGGIMTGEDAVEFLLVGASAVQVGTANFANPRACEEVIAGIEAYCRRHRVKKVTDLVGALEV
ncbi:MAG: dihydroorotate dehydrogenase [bacterium]|jgi:dihydroorotate dehydrogenase (NAD+) catalytic subunit|nr:dihydroorotate dehydrogenase [bacterium]MCZ6700130.1 dihydroorotate dehydrogenase [bacterium]